MRLLLLAPALLIAAGLAAWAQPSPPDGSALYAAKCAACHDERGWASAVLARGSSAGPWALPARKGLPAVYTRQVVRRGKGAMPGFAPTDLSDAELSALAAWLEG